MVDTRQFNALPLLSAKDGLDSSLASVSRELDAYFSEGAEGAQHLQEALAELHRITGVLRILSLDGAAVFCKEFETVLNEMQAQQQVPSAMQREVVPGALQALAHYLDALANGAPNAALRLFYTYQELHQLRGMESAFEVDLFFPDLDVSLPASVLEIPVDEAAQAQIKTARAHYQQALLKWLRQDNPVDALRGMRAAVQTVMTCVPQDRARAFWWIATGLLDCLMLDGLPPELSAKKLLGRIDLQMKSLVDNGHADEYATTCEMLYMVARSHPVSDTVENIKRLYALSSYLPEEPPLPPGEVEQVLEQMRQQLNRAQEILENCVKGDVAASQRFTEQLEQLYALSERLDRNTLQFLCKQMYSAVSDPDEPEAVHGVMMDMSMALLILGSGIEHYQGLGSNFHEQVRIIGQRLQAGASFAPLDAEGMASLTALHCQGEEQEALVPLATEMRNNMQHVERTLSEFFSAADKRGELEPLRRQLSQIHGGLYMLALETPARLAAALLRTTERYVAGDNPSAAEMRDVAAAVSALDAYMHDLIQGQKTDSSALEGLIEALYAKQEQAPSAPAEAQPAAAAPAGMSVREGSEDDELLEVFLEEAHEVLETLHTNLLACQANPASREPLITIRRSFHTLKGSGRMVGLTNLGEVAWGLEKAMNKWLQEEKPATPALLEMIGDAEVLFQHWVDRLRNGSSARIDTATLLAAAQRIEGGVESVAPAYPEPAVAVEAPPEPAPLEQALVAPEPEPEPEPVPMAPLEFAMESATAPAPELLPELLPEALPELLPAPAPLAETQDVVIGEISISPTLFKIATEEAAMNVEALQRHAAALRDTEVPVVTYDFMRAAHTLAGVNRAMGINQIAELASALELWLKTYLEKQTVVGSKQVELLDQAIARLDEMNQILRSRQEPQAQPGLIMRLQASKAQAAATAEEGEQLAQPASGEPEFELALETLEFPVEERVSEKPPVPLEELEFAVTEEIQPVQRPQPEESGVPGLEPFTFELPEMERHEAPTPEASLHVGVEVSKLPELELPAGFALQEEAEQAQPEPPFPELLFPTPPPPEEPSPATTEPFATPSATPELSEPDLNLVSYAEYIAQQEAEQAQTVAELPGAESAEATAAEVQQLDEMIAAAHAAEELQRAQQAPKQRTVRDDLDAQLLPIFLEEADELYPQISSQMRAWREQPVDSGAGLKYAHNLQRSLHTLKGSARMAGAMRLGELTHRVEGSLEKVVADKRQDPALMDELDNYFDRIANAIEQLRKGEAVEELAPEAEAGVGEAAQKEEPPAHIPEAMQPLHEAVTHVAAQPLEAGEERGAAAMLRVRSDVVDNLVNEAGEISVARSRIEIELRAFKEGLQELTVSMNSLRKLVREIEIHAEGQMQARVTVAGGSAEKFDPLEFDRFTRFQELTRFMNESVHDVQTVQQALLKNIDETAAAMSAQAQLNRELQQSLMSMRMLPFSSISQRLYRIVRQTGKELNKKVNLELRGTEVELDRGVLDKMTAPFEHLLRNSIVHGLEDAREREAKGKPALGNITLALRQEGNEVVFEFADDGAGLNLAKLRQKGLERGLIQPGDSVSDDQVMQLIFATGLSTASELTEISGRGVGMDVVRSEITGLGGRIDVFSETGKGTRFVIYLPLTLAVMKTLIVRSVLQPYAIPSVMVEQVQQIKPAELEALYGEGRVEWRARTYALHYLPSLLGDHEHVPELKPYNAVLLLRSGEQRMALHVDELLGNQEVVVKNIGPQLARLPGIAGATVQGDGKVVLILNPVQLLQQAETEREVTTVVEPVRRARVVMVVDDSLTVRKITTRLLTRAGYQVVTAKDGVDALEQLVDMTPDLMLLDVEMPRMDGFELAKQLRRDARTLHLPIIMITSRTADKHKNYALELGVDEYLGKPYQEEELLEHIARLIAAHEKA